MAIVSPEDFHNVIQKLDAVDWDLLHDSYISSNFGWYEVFQTATSQQMKACALDIYKNALKQSDLLERIRNTFGGKPVIIHCWYRSPEHNALVGGKSHSYHLQALATDFHISTLESIEDNRRVQNMLDPLGYMQDKGLEFTNGGWTHVDSRGYKARFNDHT